VFGGAAQRPGLRIMLVLSVGLNYRPLMPRIVHVNLEARRDKRSQPGREVCCALAIHRKG